MEIKEGIYLNRAVESASYVPSPDITVDYEIGGNWLPTNDLSAINPSEFMNIGYDSYAGSGVPYITKDGETVATCTGYKGAYASDPSRYLIFDNDLSTPGIYQLVIPAQSICWDEGENVCSNEYTEQNFKLISPMKNMITWPAKGSKVVAPTFLLVILPELTRPIDEFKRNKSFEIYKDGKFAGTMNPTPLWYGDFDLGCGFYRQEPGLYKITIPADAVEIGDFSKPLPEDVVFEFEIVTEDEADVEVISPSDEAGSSEEIYDLSGKKISGDPMPGIYIIRTQSTVRKIVVR